MNYLSDLHTHSIASGHGTACTITDMARAAQARGLRLLGITDHGPATPGAGTPSYFRSLALSPRRRFGIEVYYGIELNILDSGGTVDLEEPLLSRLDYAVASIHRQTYRGASRQENTQAYLNAMRNPYVRILGHCDDPLFPVDYDEIAACARERGVLLEVNEASLAPYGYRGDTAANYRELLRCCLKYQTPLVLSSDSHGVRHVGDFTCAAAFVHEASFPQELILNNQLPRLKTYLAHQ